MKRKITVGLAVLGAALVLAGGSALAKAPTALVVDDDAVQCPTAQFETINAALSAANPGDTIKVCPGLYAERLVVRKALTLKGSGPGARTRTGDPTREALIAYPAPRKPGGYVGVDLGGANGIVLEGFTIRPLDPSSQVDALGVFLDDSASGYDIRNNLITKNSFGLDFHSSGEFLSHVRGNAFVSNNLPTTRRALFFSGVGLSAPAAVGPALVNARIEGNFFTDNRAIAILLIGSPGRVAILDNELVDGHSAFDDGISLMGTTGAVLTGNTVVRSGHILLTGGTTRTTVSYNTVSGSASNGIWLANDVFGSTAAPIVDNLIEGNTVSGAAGSGIRVGSGASGNAFVDNTSSGSGELDCLDETVGFGTAATANSWLGNLGATSSPPGLCS